MASFTEMYVWNLSKIHSCFGESISFLKCKSRQCRCGRKLEQRAPKMKSYRWQCITLEGLGGSRRQNSHWGHSWNLWASLALLFVSWPWQVLPHWHRRSQVPVTLSSENKTIAVNETLFCQVCWSSVRITTKNLYLRKLSTKKKGSVPW